MLTGLMNVPEDMMSRPMPVHVSRLHCQGSAAEGAHPCSRRSPGRMPQNGRLCTSASNPAPRVQAAKQASQVGYRRLDLPHRFMECAICDQAAVEAHQRTGSPAGHLALHGAGPVEHAHQVCLARWLSHEPAGHLALQGLGLGSVTTGQGLCFGARWI